MSPFDVLNHNPSARPPPVGCNQTEPFGILGPAAAHQLPEGADEFVKFPSSSVEVEVLKKLI